LLGKQVDVLFDTVSALLGQVQGGQLKALAVTGKDRFPAVPDVPAAIESGLLPGYDVTTWYGIFAPRDVPPAIIAKLNKMINESLAEDVVRDRLTKAGVLVKGSTPEAFGKHLESEFARWNKVREAAGIPQQ
jgi:tripartite-type tricarboxylate transporter receptor subunit TctC